jgi:hypothetical protein
VIARAGTLAALALALMAGRSDPLAGRVAGEPRRCINLSLLSNGPVIEDANTIVYRQSGRRWWVTHPVDSCPSLRPMTTLILDVYGSQLCANDRFRTILPGTTIPSAYCRLGPFTPYDKPRR